jgi:hypothetical protein
MADIENAKKKLLEAISRGAYNDREIPQAAAQSVDFAILGLAAEGRITPQVLLQIYPDINALRRCLVATAEDFARVGNNVAASAMNDILVLQLATLPGGE